MTSNWSNSIKIADIRREVAHILSSLEAVEQQFKLALQQVHPDNRARARNFLHYLALRTFDLRQIQAQLSELGISSMAHAEGYVLHNLLRIDHLLSLVDNGQETFLEHVPNANAPFSFQSYREKFKANSDRLFGAPSAGHNKTHIMVTLPAEAAESYPLVREMLGAGMDVARINTSHDGPEVWRAMIDHIRRAEAQVGNSCRIYMDLSGPKLRTDLDALVLNDPERWRKKKGRVRIYRDDQMWVAENPKALGKRALARSAVAVIGCSQRDIFRDVRSGHRIFFDDGKIGGKIAAVRPDAFCVQIDRAAIEGTNLGHEKGINLPDTDLQMPSLTEEDYGNLPFIAQYADAVGYSFVRKPEDVADLQKEMRRLNRPDMGIVLKIETQEAFNRFPALMLQALQSPVIGVMIARGDLAVEIGFERIAEVQEELLWLSEAAHVPDIWATQVLDNQAKKGLATRSEITDAAMASRAACVMLNKGPYIVDAIRTLRDILSRMQQHISRKQGSLRPLSVASRFL